MRSREGASFYRKKNQPRILIIGGGAAGFFSAMRLGELLPKAQITILEQQKEVLKKVKISGGGRCNVTHACFIPRELSKNYPRGQKELMGPFNRFCTGDTIDWFAQRGVELKIEEDGRMFPITDDSQTIIDCFLRETRRLKVKIFTRKKVHNLYPPEEDNQQWKIMCLDGDAFYADKIIVATGSSPFFWDKIKHLGQDMVSGVPSLFTFKIKDPRIKGLMGVSVPMASVQTSLYKENTEGPLLITHWGMSGPAILKLSAFGARALNEANYHFDITINWTGYYTTHEVLETLRQIKMEYPKRKIQGRTQYEIPSRLWKSMCEYVGIDSEQKWADVSKAKMQKLAQQLTQAQFKVNGKSTFKEEFVTAGGVDLKGVQAKRFESKLHPGLFFAGEVLNIDAVTGGFNFQAAWTGAWMVANAIGLDYGVEAS